MRKSILILCSAILMVGCGGNTKKDSAPVMKLVSNSIKGDLSDYYEVVQKEYVLQANAICNWIINVEVKRTSVPFPFDVEQTTSYSISSDETPIQAGFGIEILDDNDNVIDVSHANAGGLGGMYSSDDMIAALKLKEGETTIIRWGVGGGYVEEGASKFRITSALDGVFKTTNISSKTNSSEWDDVLDEYEKYIDQYIKLYKKAMDGDMSAMTEYASMLENAETFV